MLFVENNNTDPYVNHGLEQWLMDEFEEDCFLLWRNQKSILVGRHQNTFDEINLPYAEEHGIHIVRRLTGGGTVFTDEGNLMFTFISRSKRRDFRDFQKFTAPVLAALNEIGVEAEFSGRNDLLIGGKKFSGNAQCSYNGAVLHHGTLMYQANTEELVKALNVRPLKLADKGVKSVRSRITNIISYMREPMEIEAFRSYLFNYVFEHTDGAEHYRLSAVDWQAASTLAENFRSEEWVYGQNPAGGLHRAVKFPSGMVEVYLDICDNVLKGVRIFGDFFGDGEIREVERALEGVVYSEDSLREALKGCGVERHFHGITAAELLSVLI